MLGRRTYVVYTFEIKNSTINSSRILKMCLGRSPELIRLLVHPCKHIRSTNISPPNLFFFFQFRHKQLHKLWLPKKKTIGLSANPIENFTVLFGNCLAEVHESVTCKYLFRFLVALFTHTVLNTLVSY